MYTALFQLCQSIYPLSEKLKEAIIQQSIREELPKQTLLLTEGKVCDKLYFIEKGLARAFHFNDGQDVTSWLMKENDMIISVYSFYSQKPSYENIELLEDSVIISLPHDCLQNLYHHFLEFNLIGRVLTQNYYLLSEQRTIALRTQTAQERYHSFLTNYPEFFRRVPLKYIASYLNMTPETLSRLRAKRA